MLAEHVSVSLVCACLRAWLLQRFEKNLREKVGSFLALRDANPGQAKVAEHVLTMFGAVLPTFHGPSRRVFITDASCYVFCRSAVRNFFSYVLQPLIEAAMAYGFSVSRHVGTMLCRLGADDRIDREGLQTVVATKLVYLLMYPIDEFRIVFVFYWGRRVGRRADGR